MGIELFLVCNTHVHVLDPSNGVFGRFDIAALLRLPNMKCLSVLFVNQITGCTLRGFFRRSSTREQRRNIGSSVGAGRRIGQLTNLGSSVQVQWTRSHSLFLVSLNTLLMHHSTLCIHINIPAMMVLVAGPLAGRCNRFLATSSE